MNVFEWVLRLRSPSVRGYKRSKKLGKYFQEFFQEKSVFTPTEEREEFLKRILEIHSPSAEGAKISEKMMDWIDEGMNSVTEEEKKKFQEQIINALEEERYDY